jgi:hypothetical protein
VLSTTFKALSCTRQHLGFKWNGARERDKNVSSSGDCSQASARCIPALHSSLITRRWPTAAPYRRTTRPLDPTSEMIGNLFSAPAGF